MTTADLIKGIFDVPTEVLREFLTTHHADCPKLAWEITSALALDELLRREREKMIEQVKTQRHGGAVTFEDAVTTLLKNMHLVTDKGMKERCNICGDPDCPEPNQKH